MAPTTPRKRAKSLLKELWQLQKDDAPMTAATLFEAKYLLRVSKHCVSIDIKTPKPRANIIDPNPFNIAEDAIPQFILCQLVDQKLIDSCNYQDTIALPAALSVISLAYSTQSIAGSFVHPTQFRWHCSRTHRSHFIFAYLDVKMRSRVYSVEELLNLKNASSPDVLAAIAFRDSELGQSQTLLCPSSLHAMLTFFSTAEMLRTKSRVSSRSYNSSSLKRGARKTMDDSSTTSDEVVFKGTIGRRSHRPEIIHPTPPAQIAEPVQPQPVQHAPTTETNPKLRVPMASESDQPMEWKYRGRSGSEITNNEPLSAPTGVDAQQNEGFQRFYKAVVSPTHVRVTAGGRIVPNTRNPVSPTAKRTKDGECITNGTQPEPASVAAAPAVPKQTLPVMGMPHPMQFFHPGFYPGMPPIHPMTGMPMPMMPPGYPFPMAPVLNATVASGNQEASLKENQTNKAENKDAKSVIESEPAKVTVKLSPPENFDHTKPFMYNGQQWMFPMFASPYPGYMGMPPPSFAGPHVPGAPMMMPPHIAVPQMVGPIGPIGMQASQGTMAPPPPIASRQPTPQPPSKPPISSIRPSQITRKQIDGLRANLKYHEDQLQFNKHQIDEKDMENKIQLLQNDIERFERVFKAQADYEEKHYPKSDKVKEDVSSSGRSSAAPSTKTSQSQSEESKESKATTVTASSQLKLKKKERSRDSVGLNSNKSSTASYTNEDTPRDRLLVTNTNRKSTLPSGAALAPVFQPRSASGVSALTFPITKGNKWQLDNTGEEITQEQLDEADKILQEAGSKAWGSTQQKQALSNPAAQRQSPRGHDDLGVPYLIGNLPHGLNNPYPTQRIEYEYSRKLTDEELHARRLYFGKAPRSVSQGLPKYDGRNFYPASPVKNMTPSESPSVRRQRIPIGVPETDYGFPAQSGKDVDPFRAGTPSDDSLKPTKIDNTKTPSAMSVRSFNSQADDHTADFRDALAETATEEDSEGTHSKGVSETRSADYHDTRANGTA